MSLIHLFFSLLQPILPKQICNLIAASLIPQGFWKGMYPGADYRDRYTSCWFTGYLL